MNRRNPAKTILLSTAVVALIVVGSFLFSRIKKDNQAKALVKAVEFQHTDEALALINAGADVNSHNADYDTPLHIASASGDNTLVQALLSHGAQIDALNTFKNTPLDYAAKRGRASTIKFLLQSGADPRLTTRFGSTPLQDAQRPLKLHSLTATERAGYMQSIALLQQAETQAASAQK